MTGSDQRHTAGRLASLAVLVCLCIAFFGAGSGPAFGKRRTSAVAEQAPRDQESLERAAELLQQATDLLAKKDLAGAARKLGESYGIDPAPEVLFQLGRLALLENRLLDAQDLFRRYLADPNFESEKNAQEQREAQQTLDQKRPPSAQLSISGDRSVLVRVDGRLVGALPLSRPLLISPDEHRIELLRDKKHLEDTVRTPVGRAAELRANFASRALLLTLLPGVIILEDYAGLPQLEQDKLTVALESAIQTVRLSPVKQRDAIEFAGEPAPGPCEDALRCDVEQARKLEADYVLRARVRKTPAAEWTLSLDLVDVTVGDSAARTTQSCASCKPEQAAALIARLFTPLYTQANARPRGKLAVKTNPAGAATLLDGRVLGRAPLVTPAWAGSHELTVRLPGYSDAQRSIQIPEGETAQVEMDLHPPPPAAEPEEPPPARMELRRMPRPLWRIISGSVLAGVGLFMVGLGGRGVALNNSPAPEVNGVRLVYDSAGVGVGLLSSGFLIMGCGVAGAAWPGPKTLVDMPAPVSVAGPAVRFDF